MNIARPFRSTCLHPSSASTITRSQSVTTFTVAERPVNTHTRKQHSDPRVFAREQRRRRDSPNGRSSWDGWCGGLLCVDGGAVIHSPHHHHYGNSSHPADRLVGLALNCASRGSLLSPIDSHRWLQNWYFSSYPVRRRVPIFKSLVWLDPEKKTTKKPRRFKRESNLGQRDGWCGGLPCVEGGAVIHNPHHHHYGNSSHPADRLIHCASREALTATTTGTVLTQQTASLAWRLTVYLENLWCPRSIHTGDFKIGTSVAIPCQTPGVEGIVLGLVDPMSVYCDWRRLQFLSRCGSMYNYLNRSVP